MRGVCGGGKIDISSHLTCLQPGELGKSILKHQAVRINVLAAEKADERGKEGEVTKRRFVVPGAVVNHSKQPREALATEQKSPSTSSLCLLRVQSAPSRPTRGGEPESVACKGVKGDKTAVTISFYPYNPSKCFFLSLGKKKCIRDEN